MVGQWIAWLGAALWYGAAGLRLMVAEPEDVRLNRMGMIRAFHQAIMMMRGVLRRLSGLGAATLLCGTGLTVFEAGQATVWQGADAVMAGMLLVVLMFHVEPLTPSSSRSGQLTFSQWLTIFLALLSVAALSLTAQDVARQVAGRSWAQLWNLTALGGALFGVALTSLALIRPITTQESPRLEVILAVVVSRWSGYLIGLNLLVLTGVIIWLRLNQRVHQWSLAILIVTSVLPLLSLLWLRLSALRRLWRSVEALPIAGYADRRMRARVVQSRRWTVIVAVAAFVSLVISLGAAGPLVAIASSPPPATPPRTTATTAGRATATPRPTPRATATLGGPAALTGQSDGVRVVITDQQFKVGEMQIQLLATDLQGQPIPNAHLTIALSPVHSTAGGELVNGIANPNGQAGAYVATITLTQADAWTIVVVVATADQSVLASITFTITVS